MSPDDPADDPVTGPAAASEDSHHQGTDAGDGVEHLQRAAHEMIAAARSFLDVVEDVVGDSAAVASVADLLGSMGQAVARAGGRARTVAADFTDAAPSSAGSDPDDGDDGRRVQHIDVS